MENNRNESRKQNKNKGNIEVSFCIFLSIAMIIITTYISIHKKVITKHKVFIKKEIGNE